MKTKIKFLAISVGCLLVLLSACTPVTRVSQSQQTWNEYKSKDVKVVKHKNTWK